MSTAKSETTEKTPKTPKAEKAPKAPKEPKPKKEKPVRATPAHMTKVDRFAATLPSMNDDVNRVFTAAQELSTSDLNVLAAHISLEARRRSTTASGSAPTLAVGDRVRIVAGNQPKWIGKEGVITLQRRIRTFVKFDGVAKPQYFFTSDCELIESAVKTIDTTEETTSEEKQAVNG